MHDLSIMDRMGCRAAWAAFRLGSMGSMSSIGTGQHGIGRVRAPRARNCVACNDCKASSSGKHQYHTDSPGDCPRTQGGTLRCSSGLREQIINTFYIKPQTFRAAVSDHMLT